MLTGIVALLHHLQCDPMMVILYIFFFFLISLDSDLLEIIRLQLINLSRYILFKKEKKILVGYGQYVCIIFNPNLFGDLYRVSLVSKQWIYRKVFDSLEDYQIS